MRSQQTGRAVGVRGQATQNHHNPTATSISSPRVMTEVFSDGFIEYGDSALIYGFQKFQKFGSQNFTPPDEFETDFVHQNGYQNCVSVTGWDRAARLHRWQTTHNLDTSRSSLFWPSASINLIHYIFRIMDGLVLGSSSALMFSSDSVNRRTSLGGPRSARVGAHQFPYPLPPANTGRRAAIRAARVVVPNGQHQPQSQHPLPSGLAPIGGSNSFGGSGDGPSGGGGAEQGGSDISSVSLSTKDWSALLMTMSVVHVVAGFLVEATGGVMALFGGATKPPHA
ncbi:hypothetical protein BJY52DRAFT_1416882 [Lactarius psammicola]|nr:hypothetical protein BJY52DRAFT_1416882 [Lactarius psammicola]